MDHVVSQVFPSVSRGMHRSVLECVALDRPTAVLEITHQLAGTPVDAELRYLCDELHLLQWVDPTLRECVTWSPDALRELGCKKEANTVRTLALRRSIADAIHDDKRNAIDLRNQTNWRMWRSTPVMRYGVF